jgi:ribosomal protein S18 acetylase RimI-like enzyme
MKILKLTEDLISNKISEFIELDKIIYFDDTWGYDNFIMNLCGKWNNSYTLVEDNEIKGYIICSLKDERTLHIHRLAVKEEYQRIGIGTQLINEVVKNADKKIKVITLKAHEDNIKARSFYEKINLKLKV